MRSSFVCFVCFVVALSFLGCRRAAPPADFVDWHAVALPPHGALQPSPRAVHLGHDGKLYVLDTAGRVLVLDPRTFAPLAVWWMPEFSVGRPEGLCLLRDGRLAIADTHYHRVVLLDAAGQVDAMFGTFGQGPGEFIYPISIDENAEGQLFVAEYGSNDRVQVFDAKGTFQRAFSAFGRGKEDLQRPAGLRLLDGKVFVADALNHRVQVFREDGTHLASFPPGGGGDLYLPYDLSPEADGGVTVVEYGNGRLSRFMANGSVRRLGSIGGGIGQFRTPWGMDAREGWVVVADTGNRRLAGFRWAGPEAQP
jgi:iron(III) transport system ATP-binding protein